MFEARFQSFEDHAERAASAPRVAALRTALARRNLTGFIVPRADRHQNEYVPAAEERLAWLTGFTGSARAAGGGVPRAGPLSRRPAILAGGGQGGTHRVPSSGPGWKPPPLLDSTKL